MPCWVVEGWSSATFANVQYKFGTLIPISFFPIRDFIRTTTCWPMVINLIQAIIGPHSAIVVVVRRLFNIITTSGFWCWDLKKASQITCGHSVIDHVSFVPFLLLIYCDWFSLSLIINRGGGIRIPRCILNRSVRTHSRQGLERRGEE